MMKNILIILLLIPFQLFSQHWYVDNTGTGDTLATIAEVNALGSGQDDTIFFKCGCMWRGKLIIPGSGAAGHYVVYNSYGTGDKPRILGSDVSASWTAEGHTNIWQSTASFIDPYNIPDSYESQIFFHETDDSIKWSDAKKTYTSNFSNLINEYDWTWNANRIYVYAASDPDSRYTSIEIPQRISAIFLDDKEYVKVDGLELAYASYWTIQGEWPQANTTGFTLSNCYLHHVGNRYPSVGLTSGNHVSVTRNDLLIKDNEICESGRRNISIHIYETTPLSISNIIIEGNYLHNGYHSTGGGVVLDNEPNNHFKNVIFRNNLVYDPDETLIGDRMETANNYANVSGCRIEDLRIYNNIFFYAANHGLWVEGCDTAKIYHNTFYDMNHYIPTVDGNIYELYLINNTQVDIKNNIFYATSDYDYNTLTLLIYSPATQDKTKVSMDYNLFYQSDGDICLIIQGNSGYYRTVNWSTLYAGTGWQQHDLGILDPLFINKTTPTETDSLMIDALSPAKDAGIAVGINTDYRDSIRDASPDIGAYEQGAISGDPPPAIAPTVTTTTPVIKNSRATTGGGNVTDIGGSAVSGRGVVWSVNPNPSLSDSVKTSGTGAGAFTAWIGLTKPGDSYHVRAYARNTTDTAYGADISFTAPLSVYSDSLSVGGIYIDSTFVRNDSLIFRGVDGKEFKIVKYIP
jgi:hypothetical protein